MNAIEQLKSVLCDPEGKCCIVGSEEDRAIVDQALQALSAPVQEPVQHWCTYCRGHNAHNCQFNTTLPRVQTYVTNTTAPAAQRQSARSAWVGLTLADKDAIWQNLPPSYTDFDVMEAVDAKLREKNA